MTTQICTECSHEYDDETVNIPTPIQDKMCFKCGTILTDEEIATLFKKINEQVSPETSTQG